MGTATASHAAEASAEADNQQPQTGQDIVVTAQRREERLLEVPVSVGVINEVQLQQSRVQEVSDLVAVTPGLSFSSTTVRGGGFRIRGVGSTAGNGEPSVSYVVDGVVFADQSVALDQNLFDTQRIEVLRGPQGTLFGKNASSGVISITTKNPTKELEGQVEGTLAEFGEREVRAVLSGPLGDELGFRIAGTHRSLDGYLLNRVTGKKSGGLNQDSIRGKLRWQHGAGTITLSADYNDREDFGLPFTERASTDPNRIALLAGFGVTPSPTNTDQAYDVPTFSGRKSGGVSLSADLDIGNHVLTSITAWRLSNNTPDSLDADGLPVSRQPGSPTLANSYNELLVEAQRSDIGRNEQMSQELRITSPRGGTLEYVGGLYGMWSKDTTGTFRTASQCIAYSAATLTSGPASPLIQVPSTSANCDHPDATRAEILSRGTTNDGNTSSTTSLAAYGQFSLRVLETVKLLGGLRYTSEERSNQAVQGSAFNQSLTFLSTPPAGVRNAFNTGAGLPPTTPIVAGTVLTLPDNPGSIRLAERSDRNLSGRAGVQFQPSTNLDIYATYARGYKGPALNIGTGVYTDPEKSNAYEAGIKALLADRKITANLAVFLTDYSGFQANSFDTTLSRYVIVNAGNVRTKGFEADFTAQPIEGLDLNASVTYAKARVTDFRSAAQCYPGQPIANTAAALVPNPPRDGSCYIIGGTAASPIYGQNVNGGRLPGSTDWKFNVGARYAHPIGQDYFGLIGMNYTWQSDALFDLSQDPNTRQKGYGTFDLNVGFGPQSRRWTITAFARNLFDKQFASTILYTPTSQVNVLNNAPSSATVPATANASPGNYVQLLPRNAFRQFGVTVRLKFGGKD
ncbi:TonB-dependent receptor [Novosphingobium aquae]|uniref:TonB-dependent receptor n=1 Tax=Novosphingobium aquae TaxID=3133435 RepID=A0ABU8SAK0_9SPHN